MAGVVSFNEKELKDFLEKNDLVLVDFYADWCGPCKIIGPILEDLSKDLEGKVSFGKMDLDKNREIAIKYGIMSIPTLLIFKKGKMVDRLTGAVPKEMIRERLEKFID